VGNNGETVLGDEVELGLSGPRPERDPSLSNGTDSGVDGRAVDGDGRVSHESA